jgi:hypothetical protein
MGGERKSGSQCSKTEREVGWLRALELRLVESR